jgi:hypothetical protein
MRFVLVYINQKQNSKKGVEVKRFLSSQQHTSIDRISSPNECCWIS